MAEEKEVPWGHVVEGDEVWSAKANKWFTIAGTVLTKDGVKARAEGVAKYWPPQPADKMVKVRRGGTGKAVDILLVAFSGEMGQV